MISRRNLLNMKRKQVILVDHNEKTQAVDGVDGAEILEIIDHHRLGSLETISPVFFRNQPLGNYLPDVPGTRGNNSTGNCRAFMLRHYIGHFDVPFPYLYPVR
jgi:hypothetical protein